MVSDPSNVEDMRKSLSDKDLYQWVRSKLPTKWGKTGKHWEPIAKELAKLHVSPRTGRPLTPGSLRKTFYDLERVYGENSDLTGRIHKSPTPLSRRSLVNAQSKIDKEGESPSPLPPHAPEPLESPEKLLAAVREVINTDLAPQVRVEIIRRMLCR